MTSQKKLEGLETIIYLPLVFYIMATIMYMITVENNLYKALDAAMLVPTTFAIAYPIYRYISKL